jgi:hypothetical protein
LSDDALPNSIFRDQVLQRFEGRTEPATVADVARLYRAVLVIHDELMTMTDVALNRRKLNITELFDMKERHMEIIKNISEGLLDLDKRAPENE